MSIYPLHR